jgi:hypothetical protein
VEIISGEGIPMPYRRPRPGKPLRPRKPTSRDRRRYYDDSNARRRVDKYDLDQLYGGRCGVALPGCEGFALDDHHVTYPSGRPDHLRDKVRACRHCHRSIHDPDYFDEYLEGAAEHPELPFNAKDWMKDD